MYQLNVLHAWELKINRTTDGECILRTVRADFVAPMTGSSPDAHMRREHDDDDVIPTMYLED